jgi:T5orf172 domain
MESLNIIEPPAFNFLSLGNGNNNRAKGSILPKTLRKLANKKPYSRISNRYRSKQKKLSPTRAVNRQMLQKWPSVYSTSRRRSSTGTQFPSNYSRPSLSSSSSPLTLTPSKNRATTPSPSPLREPLSTPSRNSRSSSDIFLDRNNIDIDNDTEIPSPIRNSPSFGRRAQRGDDNSHQGSNLPSSIHNSLSNPQLLSQKTIEKHFEKYNSKNEHDSTIDIKLMKMLHNGPKGERHNRVLGRVYIMTNDEDNRYVKIGWTSGSIEARENGISPGRRYGNVQNEADITPGGQSRFYNSYHAEQIIHQELYSCRHKFAKTKSGKTEWFEVNVDEAKTIVNKWRQWLIKWKPYDRNGQLKPFWKMRIEQAEAHDPYNEAKHKNLHLRWNKILNATWWDISLYRITVGWRMICVCWTEHKLPSSVFVIILLYSVLPILIWALTLTLVGLVANWSEPSKHTPRTRRQRKYKV